MPKFNGKLDVGTQCDCQDWVAAYLFDNYGISEADADKAAKEIVVNVADFIAPKLIEN